MNNKRNNDHIYNMVQFVITESTLGCDTCDKTIESDDDDYGLATDAYSTGWRATENNVYCPKCVKKYKIKK